MAAAAPAAPALVLPLAGTVLAAAVAIGVDAAWIVVLPVGIGLGAVWATRRRGVRDGLAHERLENELRLHIRELRDSRARLGQVADAERRRIERDLHDGCQQHLVALLVKLSLAKELVIGDDSAMELIHEIAEDAESAIEDLHALVHGIYPSILLDRGLASPGRTSERSLGSGRSWRSRSSADSPPLLYGGRPRGCAPPSSGCAPPRSGCAASASGATWPREIAGGRARRSRALEVQFAHHRVRCSWLLLVGCGGSILSARHVELRAIE